MRVPHLRLLFGGPHVQSRTGKGLRCPLFRRKITPKVKAVVGQAR